MLQHIKTKLSPEDALYISLDDIYFREHSFVEVAERFYKHGGKNLYADEVHKYPDWQQELKNIYDFSPELKIVVSGSSIIALQKSQADLSRRLLRYQLPELSLREFIALKDGIELPFYSLEEILTNSNKIVNEILNKLESPLKSYSEYMTMGAYPIFMEGIDEYLIRVNQLINVIIDYDLPEAIHIETATQAKLKKLLYILSTSVPFKPNIAKLARKIGTTRKRLLEMLNLLEKGQLIHNLRSDTHGISLMNKPDKIYLHNTSMIMALAEGQPNKGNLRETYFLSQLKNAGHKVTYPKTGDFLIDNEYLFEVGGKNRTRQQIAGKENTYLAVDDIEVGSKRRIPLWLAGFLY